MKNKENLSLIIGLSLPVILIIVVVLSVYLPKFFAPNPHTNFIYSIEDNYYFGGSRFSVKDEHIEKGELEVPPKEELIYPPTPDYEEPRLFLYDVKTEQSSEISFEEAQKYSLDTSRESKDGFSVNCANNSGGFAFFIFDSGSDCRRQFLMGHGVGYKVNFDSKFEDYRYQFIFQGWVTGTEN